MSPPETIRSVGVVIRTVELAALARPAHVERMVDYIAWAATCAVAVAVGAALVLPAWPSRRDDGSRNSAVPRERLWAISRVGAKAIVPIVEAPPDRPIIVQRTDSPEPDVPDRHGASDTLTAWSGITVMIEYEDAQGGKSCRRVTIKGSMTTAAGAVVLRCWCHERQAPRAFRLERIRSVINPRTGEVHDDVARFFADEVMDFMLSPPAIEAEFMHRAATRRRSVRSTARVRRPRTPLASRLAHAMPEIVVLVYLGRADGRFRAAEKRVVTDHALELAPDLGEELSRLERFIGRMTPERDNFDVAVKAIDWGSDRPRALLDALARLATADGDVSPEEDAIVRAFSDAIGDRVVA